MDGEQIRVVFKHDASISGVADEISDHRGLQPRLEKPKPPARERISLGAGYILPRVLLLLLLFTGIAHAGCDPDTDATCIPGATRECDPNTDATCNWYDFYRQHDHGRERQQEHQHDDNNNE